MDQNSIVDWYFSIPPVTRTYLTGIAVVAILCVSDYLAAHYDDNMSICSNWNMLDRYNFISTTSSSLQSIKYGDLSLPFSTLGRLTLTFYSTCSSCKSSHIYHQFDCN